MRKGTDAPWSASMPGPEANEPGPEAQLLGEATQARPGDRTESGFRSGEPREGRRRVAGAGRGGRRGGDRSARGPFYAALDLGTNNCRLLIAEPSGEGFRVVDSFSRIVRLGEGVAQTGALNPEAMERAIGALKICQRKLGDRRVAAARLIATEACRRASNGAEFLERIREEVGLDLEIVDRRTEARLAAEGCYSLLDRDSAGAVLFDIGGGSTEIVWLDRQKRRRRGSLVRAWVSLPVGVVTLAERFGGVDVGEAVFDAMVEAVRSEFAAFNARDTLKAAVADRDFHFLGTSGTVTTLAGVYLELPRYDRRYVDGLWMAEDDIERMMQKIRGMDYEGRRTNPCIGGDRADLVLAGCAIFEAIRKEWPCKRLRVGDRGLREGILMQLMRADGHARRGRLAEVEAIIRRP